MFQLIFDMLLDMFFGLKYLVNYDLNTYKTISYITLTGFIIYLLLYKFDLNLFNKNLKEFINEFLEMIKVVRGVIEIVTS